MDNFKNMEPGIKDTAVFDSTNKESKKKESRPVISAKAQTILEFLRNCTPYEADSIRVMVGYGMGKGDIGTIKQPTCWPSTVSSITGLPKNTEHAEKPS